LGIHHITAIAGEPQRNLDFYAGTLGLRLVKLTVNYDDVATYHLYFGDELGRPGSILTFFPWPHGRRGRQGTGQAGAVSLAIPSAALGFWIERLLSRGIRYNGPARRFDEQVLSFSDPDGLLLELVTSPQAAGTPAGEEGPVMPEHAILGLHGTTLWEDGDTGTADLLVNTLGFDAGAEQGGLIRFQSSGPGPGRVVYLRQARGFWGGAEGVGTVHHVAFRAATEQAQLDKRSEIEAKGIEITPVIDRKYFRSVYFREPGGVLFEIATDAPGFTIDEPPGALGKHLMLPPGLEARRRQIEDALPGIRLPQARGPSEKMSEV
jgi:catechol 2,3-dioxygenase-like lactoylglutathione lyase family enzyme